MEPFKLSQDEIERLFAGKSAADAEHSEMAAFIEEVRADSISGLAPSFEATQLAALLEVVHNTEKGELAARPESKVTGPDSQASGLPKWRKRMFGNAAGALAIKVLGGAVALAASTVGLAAADLLPGEAQTPVADVVKNVAGVDLPGATDKVKKDKKDKDDLDADLAESEENEAEIDLDETDEGQVPVNHGQYVSCVSHMAHEDEGLTPGQHGQIVSFAAGQKDVTLSKEATDEQCEAAYAAAKAGAGVTSVEVEGDEGPGNSQGRKDADDNQAEKAGERPDKPEQAEDPSDDESKRGPARG